MTGNLHDAKVAYLAVLIGLCSIKGLSVNHDRAASIQASCQAPQIPQVRLWWHIACKQSSPFYRSLRKSEASTESTKKGAAKEFMKNYQKCLADTACKSTGDLCKCNAVRALIKRALRQAPYFIIGEDNN